MVHLCCLKPLSLRHLVPTAAKGDELRGFWGFWCSWDTQGPLVRGSGAQGSGIRGWSADRGSARWRLAGSPREGLRARPAFTARAWKGTPQKPEGQDPEAKGAKGGEDRAAVPTGSGPVRRRPHRVQLGEEEVKGTEGAVSLQGRGELQPLQTCHGRHPLQDASPSEET